ncbi:glutaminyl-peptide cyclotransferase [Deinococcus metallilatus]|uniref:Glutaminyl-peptide cyclotransferase n=2 Tax=Deinococcus metallilatus TaxID=1211322 RepID=A0AAJ5F338_9DEIO|nr:glutaminyl-peptide cyclotransferase [Deinococcus metallilatus]RXJ12878.1 glutaminyl-peptide cyclotransferase [Deinococcus metallilatus]TLK27199.1 glutaminyl-peptide cyclotransferase [Deinococcus metallilatus]GMA16177.1 glutamine cyclotransferase [Deinococcus metallilatus]
MRGMRARPPLPAVLTAALVTLALMTVTVTPARASLSPSTPVLRPAVTARYPHDRAAFTEGLQYLGGGLLIESTGQVGESGVRRWELKSGRVLAEVPTPLASAFGEGVSVLNGVAYHLTWQSGVAFALDAATLRELGRYRYSGEGWGLTNDGRSLIMSDGSSTLFWRDPKTFAVTRTLRVTDQGQPVKNLNELEYVQGSVYANIWLTDRIARIDPKTGNVTAWLDVQSLMQEASTDAAHSAQPLTFDDVSNGIAFVPERGTLLLTGKRWPTVFEVKVPGIRPETGTTGRAGSRR